MAQSGRSWNDPKSARGRAPQAGDGAGSAKPAGSSAAGGGRASWRSKSAPAVTQRGKDRHWLVSKTENPNRLRYRVKLAIGIGAFLLLFGAFLVYTLWAPRNTPLLLVGILDYAAPLPPNAWTFEDFDRFRSTLGEEGAGSAQNVRVYSGLSERQWKNGDDALVALEQTLRDRDMRPAGPDRNTVLIYLSAHGIVDAEGRPCLVLATDRGNANLWQPQLNQLDDLPVVDLQKLLDTVEKSYADRSATKKVVLLDCHRIQANARFGILENRFGEALKRLQFKDENLYVLCSADAGQLGWTLPDRGASAFGYYVCQGLAGRADDTGNEDGVVTLDELEQYLRTQVSEQVYARYLVEQTPILLGAKGAEEQAAEISLAWAHPETEADAAEEIAPPVPWPDVDELWAQHETLKESGAATLTDATRRWRSHYDIEADPQVFYRGADLLSWEAFQQGLLRLEELNDAGRHYADEAERLSGSLALLADKFRENTQRAPLPAALALRQVDAPASVQGQVKKFIDGPVTEADQEEYAKLLKEKYEPRAKAIWNRWVAWSQSGQPGGIADFRRTLDLLAPTTDGSANKTDQCDPIEIRFLRLLDPNLHAPQELYAAESPALRSAIRSRDLAEAAAWANDDVRAHYVVQRLVERGDAARRSAEDQLFIDPSALKASGEPWTEAEQDYAKALALAVQLSQAIDARDQACQELPYLAHWLVLRRGTDSDLSSVGAEIARCQQLFAHNRTLADKIDRLLDKSLSAPERPDEETAKRFTDELEQARQELVAATTTVRDNLDRLLQFHRRATSDARLAAAPDVLNPREIRDLFSTPLLTGDDRRALRETLVTSRRNVTLRTDRDEQPASGAVPLAEHPLLALFGGDAAALAADPGRLAGKLRTILHTRFNALAASSPPGETSLVNRSDRMKLTAAERDARSLAALWTLPPVYRDPEKYLGDPLATIEEFDRHHAILWQARRALDDFWGREGDPRDVWYFDALATVALDEARRIGPQEGSAAYKSIDATLIERRQAARQWIAVTVPSVQLPPTGSRMESVNASPAISVATKIPTGEAVLLAALAGKQPTAMRFAETAPWKNRLALALRAPADAAGPTAPLATPVENLMLQVGDALADARLQTWNLNLFYRGHVFSTEFVGSPKEPGQLYELVRTPPPDPRIFVEGIQRDRGSVSLIFDCSGSMNATLPGSRSTTIMDAAKDALREIVKEVADAQSYRFSLWFYGHRYRYHDNGTRNDTSDDRGVLNVREFYANRPDLLNLMPREWGQPDTAYMSEDVALEWPFTPNANPVLTKNRVGEVLNLIEAAQPAGVTPLYLALVRAIQEDLNLKPNISPRRLILLTDGKNEIYPSEKRPEMRPQDVVAAFRDKGRGIETHMVAFGALARETAAEKEIKGILDDIKQPKNYHKILPDLSNLEEVVRQIIGLLRYEVVRVDRRASDPIQEKLNRQVILDDHTGRQEYLVRVVGSNQPHRLVLEGGEEINLFVVDTERANPRLVHRRYATNEERKDAFAYRAGTNGAAEKHYVGFRRTERNGSHTIFPISIQHADETQFSPRPAEAWVEITPLGLPESDKVKPFVFYDLDFADGRPVPVLECRALNWPPRARSARIKLFFKMNATDATLRRFVSEVEDDNPHPDLDLSLPEGGKVQFTVSVDPAPEYKGARITVTEHCSREADLHQAKVEIETPADVVRRQYFHSADKHEVRHDFIYTGKVQADLAQYRLSITSRQDLETGAAAVHDVIEIPVN